MNATIIDQLKAARRVSVPLVAINTPDPEATMKAACQAINGESPKIEWDCIRGLSGRNDSGRDWVAQLGEGVQAQFDPVSALVLALKLPEKAVLFVHLANRFIGESPFVQAAWNLRDQFKNDHRTLILLAKSLPVPAELSDDILVLDEPLPDGEQLAGIVGNIHKAAGQEAAEETTTRAVEALRGLSAFAAEQVTAMSIRKAGLHLDSLWDRKRQVIEQTPGLKVFRGGETFSGVGGCEIVKGFLSRIMQGHARPNAVVFIDEIEKAMGGKGDTSGVSQDQLGALLAYMQDTSAAGMIFIGPPGAAKSAIAKAAGDEGGVPTIQLDLGAAKGSLVGQSEQQLRQALKVITAVSNSRSLWIATCNSIADLPPELRRRFTLGTYFFDLPTADERNQIWAIYTRKYNLIVDDAVEAMNDEGWTGAEIKQCCDIAWRLGCHITEAAQFIVPVSRSAADALARLREQASGRFLSASYPGVYLKDAPAKAEHNRRLTLED